jgi:hypothetical protein
MYQPPTIYENSRTVNAEALKQAQFDMLADLHNCALEEVVEAANAVGDYLDLNSVEVTVTVKARAL